MDRRYREGNANTACPRAQAALEPRLAKYAKQLKMGVPAPAVENKMLAEGCSKADTDAVFERKVAKKSGPAPLEPRLAKYAKQLKMGVPPAAVEAKMLAEGCSRADEDAVFERTRKDKKPEPQAAATGTTLLDAEIAKSYFPKQRLYTLVLEKRTRERVFFDSLRLVFVRYDFFLLF